MEELAAQLAEVQGISVEECRRVLAAEKGGRRRIVGQEHGGPRRSAQWATALQPFESEEAGDLCFAAGARLAIESTDRPGEGWWTGSTATGAAGVFPASHVRLDGDPAAAAAAATAATAAAAAAAEAAGVAAEAAAAAAAAAASEARGGAGAGARAGADQASRHAGAAAAGVLGASRRVRLAAPSVPEVRAMATSSAHPHSLHIAY
jgi:hypothetical protein